MTAKELGKQQAYPCDDDSYYYEGLTKREEFARSAMQGLLSFYGKDNLYRIDEYARDSVKCADALLEELCK